MQIIVDEEEPEDKARRLEPDPEQSKYSRLYGILRQAKSAGRLHQFELDSELCGECFTWYEPEEMYRDRGEYHYGSGSGTSRPWCDDCIQRDFVKWSEGVEVEECFEECGRLRNNYLLEARKPEPYDEHKARNECDLCSPESETNNDDESGSEADRDPYFDEDAQGPEDRCYWCIDNDIPGWMKDLVKASRARGCSYPYLRFKTGWVERLQVVDDTDPVRPGLASSPHFAAFSIDDLIPNMFKS